jgi:hypothetical protein
MLEGLGDDLHVVIRSVPCGYEKEPHAEAGVEEVAVPTEIGPAENLRVYGCMGVLCIVYG